ncbi:peptidoglycan recognition protein family protein [Streptomyces tagetis]|uniref:Peptidoglycan recognition protein n=1 Tax=Streptomyces tagetis TaxID=2820809 RepID=A0A940XFU2_9ACTN|nr:peptidoglycan recognition protein [Streptomyces sp. RG38]MBQ0829578.1 peptidoglycan recognition protein [Streptomyces sp. RG38]
MRGFLASSIGVTCATALALPAAALPATASPATPASPTPPGTGRTTATAPTAVAVPGATRSLPLRSLARDRAPSAPGTAQLGVPRQSVRPFSLVGVVWDDPGAPLHGQVQVRTRAAGTGTWSHWRDLETHQDDHAPDPATAESARGGVRGATAPLWVGDADGVELRVRAEDGPGDPHTRGPARPLPSGLRLELVDPGGDLPAPAPSGRAGAPATPATPTAPTGPTTPAAPATELPATELPALDRAATEREALDQAAATEGQLAGGTGVPAGQRAKRHIGPRPAIVTRHGWGADEKLREQSFVHTKEVRAAFVHHTATGNDYRCAQAPSVIRGIYRYHVRSLGWRDVGYNFFVDKCGKIYEGRAGGVAEPVLGAHTMGFNANSTGIAVLGTFGSHRPPSAAVTAVARLTAWKLGLQGVDPRGTTSLKSAGGNLHRKGRTVRLNTISGHRDGFSTSCPGAELYAKLGTARSAAASYQGR